MRKNSQSAPRRPRSDARRNRERLLETAKAAFTRHGADASLEEIAKQAGVGTGTLYRHFATRDALIEAVYRSEVEKLAAAAGKFAETMPPVEALRTWMLLLIDYIEAKHIIAPALNSLAGGPARLYEDSRSLIHGAIEALVKHAKKDGALRRDVDASDLLRALIGASYVGAAQDWQPSARRLVDILITGSRRSDKARSGKPAMAVPSSFP